MAAYSKRALNLNSFASYRGFLKRVQVLGHESTVKEPIYLPMCLVLWSFGPVVRGVGLVLTVRAAS